MEKALEKTDVKKTLKDLTIKELVLSQPKKQFIASGCKEEDFVREAGFALQIIEGNQTLMGSDRKSIVNSIVNVALTKLSLNPELKLGYLIPYKGKCYFRSSYMGKREIILRTGNVKDFYVKLVYSNDRFETVEGTKKELIHIPNYFGERGELMGGYWVAEYANGIKDFDCMPAKRIKEIRDKYSESHKAAKANNKKDVWDEEFDEMAKKTICNWGFKQLPKTGITRDVLNALAAEDELEKKEFEDYLKRKESEDIDTFEDEEFSEAEVIEGEKPPETITKPVIKEKDMDKDKVSVEKEKLPEAKKQPEKIEVLGEDKELFDERQ